MDDLFDVQSVPLMRLHVVCDDPSGYRKPYTFGQKLHGRPFQLSYRPKKTDHVPEARKMIDTNETADSVHITPEM